MKLNCRKAKERKTEVFTNFLTIFFSVSERLTAMKRLSENPQDPQALKQLYEAQKEMSK